MTELQHSVVSGLRFVDGFLADFVDGVLFAEEVDQRKINQDLHLRLRTRLPVPTIYCALKILERLVTYFQAKSAAVASGEDDVVFPKVKNDVDYTVKKIYKSSEKKIDRFADSQADFQDLNWNAFELVEKSLNVAVEQNLALFFGI